MADYAERLDLIRRSLKLYGLLPDDRTLSIFDDEVPRRGDRTLLTLSRSSHELKVIGISDGAIMLAMVAASEVRTFIALLADPGDHWYVRVDGNFADFCSGPMLDLWQKLPKRADVDTGRLNCGDTHVALNRFVYIFSAL